jgi:hypothetical protein
MSAEKRSRRLFVPTQALIEFLQSGSRKNSKLLQENISAVLILAQSQPTFSLMCIAAHQAIMSVPLSTGYAGVLVAEGEICKLVHLEWRETHMPSRAILV